MNKLSFAALANGEFARGLDELNEDPLWHDPNNDLNGPFILGFPCAQGYGEDLFVASLLKRHYSRPGQKVKVFTKFQQVHSILSPDSSFDVRDSIDQINWRSPLAVLRAALIGDLLEKDFIPISPANPSVLRSDAPRIGIVWASVSKKKIIREKSVPLDQFLQIVDGIKAECVCLQRQLDVADPRKELPKSVRTLSDDVVNDDKYIAKLIKEILNLDVVLTISTTIAHIAAILGVKVELIAAKRKGQQWFWQAQAHHCRCFYPTVQVHLGEKETGDWWKPCLQKARESLLKCVEP